MLNYGYNPYLFQTQQTPQAPTQQTQTQTIKTIPVTNKNEANSIIPDPTGIPILFLNKGANEIYLKQVDQNTGLGIFKEYALKPVEEQQTQKYKDYDKDFKALSAKLDEIKTVLEKGNKNAK